MREFDISVVWKSVPKLLPYVFVTIYATVIAFILALLLGSLIAAGKLSKNPVARALANGYTTVMRCTPTIVMLFIVFYGIPKFSLQVFGKSLDEWPRAVFVILGLTLLFSASLSETIRSAYQAVPKGQFEAAYTSGLGWWSAHFRIIYPQMTYIALPNIGNTVISLLKEGSNAFTIGFIDLIGKANLMVSMNLGARSREIYLSAAMLYLVLVLLIEFGLRKAEKAVCKGRRGQIK